ncbi:Cytosolic Carboxypeptidase 4 [Manis pentadactyla]|nr:Cytosolic Carboxypeptidase 4 [Manis pentadactyla]
MSRVGRNCVVGREAGAQQGHTPGTAGCSSAPGQCPPRLSCARHHCPGAAEARRRASVGATPLGGPFCCSPSQRYL